MTERELDPLSFIESDEDYVYEQEVARQPFLVRTWVRYLEHKRFSPARTRNYLYERALKHVPGSYKLWFAYLTDRTHQIRDRSPTDPVWERLNTTFERALVFMHKMPRIWIEYTAVLVGQRNIARIRRTFDRALRALPVTQHETVWRPYLSFARQPWVPYETARRVYRRALQFDPCRLGEWIDWLVEHEHWTEAAEHLCRALNDRHSASYLGRTRHELWTQLCDIVTTYPGQIRSLTVSVESVVRDALRKFSHETGHLWCALADYFIRLGQFEKARDIFDEAIRTVATSRDFATVFDAFVQFEERVLSVLLGASNDDEEEDEEEADEVEGDVNMDRAGTRAHDNSNKGKHDQNMDSTASISAASTTPSGVVRSSNRARRELEESDGKSSSSSSLSSSRRTPASPTTTAIQPNQKSNNAVPSTAAPTETIDVDIRLARLEYLLDQRPLLLNAVLLRQNPHNVHEWLKRAKLFAAAREPIRVIETFTDAVRTVDPLKATGKAYVLWLKFAEMYETAGQVEQARSVFERAVLTSTPYRNVEDLSQVWCEYAEMEIRQKQYQRALKVLERATTQQRPTRTFVGPNAVKSASASSDASEGGGLRAHEKLYRSNRLWSLFVDLEESIGTFDRTRTVYERMFQLRVVQPTTVLNYASFLEENEYFEDAFRVYERGVAMFPFPHSLPLWRTYILRFRTRYVGDDDSSGKHCERMRDLFEQACKAIPSEYCREFYLQYAEYEEKYGLARNAMRIYDQCAQAVPAEQKLAVYEQFVDRASKLFGIGRAREVYGQALENVRDDQITVIGLQWADLERRLGEIDRARSLFLHCAQYNDPRAEEVGTLQTKSAAAAAAAVIKGAVEGPQTALSRRFWKTWYDFEVAHGNEDTFREMLRVKRSVMALYGTSVNFSSANLLIPKQRTEEEIERSFNRERRQGPRGLGSMPQSSTSSASSSSGSSGTGQPDNRKFSEIPMSEDSLVSTPSVGGKNISAADESEILLDDDGVHVSDSSSSGFGKRTRDDGDGGDGGDDDDDGGNDGPDVAIEQKPIPAAIFGGLGKDSSSKRVRTD